MGCAQSSQAVQEPAAVKAESQPASAADPVVKASENGSAQTHHQSATPPPAQPTAAPAPQAAELSQNQLAAPAATNGGSEPLDARPPTQVTTNCFAGEFERLTNLQNCNVLDTPPEPRFDQITKLVKTIFQTPVALVSLVDQDRLWFKSIQGPFGSCVDRQGSFCDMVLVPTRHEVLVVENATTDARFSDNPFVKGPPGLRFYAGAPLVSSKGHRLGTLCVCDLKPRKVNAGLLNTLCNFAELVVREMERDEMAPALKQEKEEKRKRKELIAAGTSVSKLPVASRPLLRHAATFRQGVVLIDTRSPDWQVLYANDAWGAAMSPGLPAEQHPAVAGESFWSQFKQGSSARQSAEKAVASGTPASVFVVHAATGKRHRVTLKPAATDQIQTDILVGIPNFVPVDEADARMRAEESTTSADGSPADGDGLNKSDSAVSLPGAAPFWFATVEAASLDSTNSSAGSSHNSQDGLSSNASAKSVLSAPGSGKLQLLNMQGQSTPASLKGIKLGPLLGAGGFGRVYRATWQGVLVAVKVLETYEPVRDRKGKPVGPLAEAYRCKTLRHPNIVQAFDFAARDQPTDTVDGQKILHQVWIIQQFCNRGTLYDGIDRGWLRKARSLEGAPNPEAIYQTAIEIASAVTYLHSQNIVHGDLTGSNVMLTSSTRDDRRFTAMIADFGLARAASPPGSATKRTETYGTVSHQPAELLSEGILTPAVDVYAMGVLLWELWMGARAYLGYKPARIIYLVTSGQADLYLSGDCPTAYRELCESCLQADYMQRPSSKEVLSRLVEMAGGKGKSKDEGL